MIRPHAAKAAALLFLVVHAGAARAETRAIPFTPGMWAGEAAAVRFEDHLGRHAMRLEDGEAVIRGLMLRDGLIEFDVAIQDRRGFAGVNFRRADQRNAERFYLRAHQSGNPDANQYTPIFNGMAGWQIYYGPHYSAPTEYRHEEWMRISIIVRGEDAEVHLDGEPILRFNLLREPLFGGVALWANLSPAWFSNVRVSDLAPPFELPPPSPPASAPGVLLEWEVSEAFSWNRISRIADLDPRWVDALSWRRLASEPNGIANIARLADRRNGDTVFARVSMPAQRASTVRFGFSDAVRVFIDGRMVYAGDDTYASRDYRFLGTVGLYDTLFIAPESEEVELLFAVREGFGGWAIHAAASEPPGWSPSRGAGIK